MKEEDTPIRRRRLFGTEAVDEPTRPRSAGGDTSKLPPAPWDEQPPPLIREPTQMIQAPDALTSQLPAAEAPVSVPVQTFDRLGSNADRLAAIASSFEVERLPVTAAFIAGISAGLSDEGTQGAIAHVGRRLVQRTMLADNGVGGGLSESQIAHLLVDVAAEVLGNIDAYRQAQLRIGEELKELSRKYHGLAEAADKRNDQESANMWRTRAHELASQARRLKQGHDR